MKTDETDGEILAAIAAGVALMIHKPHQIVEVKEASPLQLEVPAFIVNPWSMEGRFQHFGSHKVR